MELVGYEDVETRSHEALASLVVHHSAYRFVNAVSDFATHREPYRKTVNYKENMFMKTVDGNALIDTAYKMVKEMVA